MVMSSPMKVAPFPTAVGRSGDIPAFELPKRPPEEEYLPSSQDYAGTTHSHSDFLANGSPELPRDSAASGYAPTSDMSSSGPSLGGSVDPSESSPGTPPERISDSAENITLKPSHELNGARELNGAALGSTDKPGVDLTGNVLVIPSPPTPPLESKPANSKLGMSTPRQTHIKIQDAVAREDDVAYNRDETGLGRFSDELDHRFGETGTETSETLQSTGANPTLGQVPNGSPIPNVHAVMNGETSEEAPTVVPQEGRASGDNFMDAPDAEDSKKRPAGQGAGVNDSRHAHSRSSASASFQAGRARAASSGQRSAAYSTAAFSTVAHSTAAPSTTSRKAAAMAAAELEDEVLVGTRVSEGHENFVTAYNMLTGIRVAVSRCTAKNNRKLTQPDFSATDEISFDLSGGGHSPSSKFIFQFKDYAPWVFRHLRDLFGLDPADYLMSLTAKYIVSELGSPGKSGSFFYYSRDYRFIIKTIRHSEHKLLRNILREYYSHVKRNPETLISQFYGLHRVKLPFGRKIHFVVMNNVFPALYEIHERFDLKGSLLGREYRRDLTKPIVVYKDLDWLRQHKRIVVGNEKRERLVRQLEIDTKFLERVNVMDYSLLVGIHDMAKGNAALHSLLKLAEFGPQDERQSQGEKRAASAALRGSPALSGLRHNAQKDFWDLQQLLQKATPERLREFDFSDEQRSRSYFYKDHGGFLSTNDLNEELDVIYYVGVIDFLTGYTFRKSVETFCKSLIHDRKDLSSVPAKEYGERFLKFLRGSIGPNITPTKPQHNRKATADEGHIANASASMAQPSAGTAGASRGNPGVRASSNSRATSPAGLASQPVQRDLPSMPYNTPGETAHQIPGSGQMMNGQATDPSAVNGQFREKPAPAQQASRASASSDRPVQSRPLATGVSQNAGPQPMKDVVTSGQTLASQQQTALQQQAAQEQTMAADPVPAAPLLNGVANPTQFKTEPSLSLNTQFVTTPINERPEFMSATTPQPRISPGTAITKEGILGETAAASPVSPILDGSARRPSVLMYGQDVPHIEA